MTSSIETPTAVVPIKLLEAIILHLGGPAVPESSEHERIQYILTRLFEIMDNHQWSKDA